MEHVDERSVEIDSANWFLPNYMLMPADGLEDESHGTVLLDIGEVQLKRPAADDGFGVLDYPFVDMVNEAVEARCGQMG
jgi:hypothetical protein